MDLSLQRCCRHAQREAAARCLECRRFFCRECVTEHEERLICSDCLAKLTRGAGARIGGFRLLLRLAGGFTGFFLAWLFFYGLGQFLLSIPASFHEGTYWIESLWNDADK